jgi:hypothetical protein
MLVEKAISRIKSAGHDISNEYSQERCLEFINTAIQQVSALLISAQYPSLIDEITVHNGESLPSNYMKSAGNYPLKMIGNVVSITDGSDTVRFRYWKTPALVSDTDRELPFNNDAVNEVVVKLAVMLALNENEYDIAQDSNLTSQLQQAIASGMA